MAQFHIELQKRGFCVEIPTTLRLDWDHLADMFLGLGNVREVDGPLINGCIGVVFDNDPRTDAELVDELNAVIEAFMEENGFNLTV